MIKKKKIPIQKFIDDLTSGHISGQTFMTRYGLNYQQLIFAMGKLAERKKISFKKIVALVRSYLEGKEFEKAESSIRIIQKYFMGVYGVQAMLKGLERDLYKLKNQMEFQKTMNDNSRSLQWFQIQYPGISLHSAVVSSVKVLDFLMDNKDKNKHRPDPGPDSSDARLRLGSYPKYVDIFKKYNMLEATRIWHQISLHLFYQKNIQRFTIKAIMDIATRDICMHLDGISLPVKQVLAKVIENNRKGRIFPEDKFPSLMDVENIPMKEKIEILMNHEWYLPPFCENCRCQIFPCQ